MICKPFKKLTRDEVSLPIRDDFGNKGTFGRLLHVTGCNNMLGASIMASKSALRCGVGLVVVSTPKFELLPLTMPEPIYLGRDIPSLDREISKASAVLIGCGLGTGEDSVETFKYVLNTVKCPTVIDADGINILASRIDIDTIRGRNIVLTPHPLEMSRLTNMSVEDVQNNRFEVAITFAKKYQCVLVLKGANSIITNGEDVYIDTHPNSGLAKGGSGDVLAGIISSFMAQGLSPFEASKLGVYLHSQCGLACAERLTEYSCLPTDLIEEIPNQIKGMSIEVILR